MVSKEVYEYAVKQNEKFKKKHNGVGDCAYEAVIDDYIKRIKRENKNF